MSTLLSVETVAFSHKPQPQPAHKCRWCNMPVYNGVRIDRSEVFCKTDYRNDNWIIWYLQGLDRTITIRQMNDLQIEHFADNGITSSLKNSRYEP